MSKHPMDINDDEIRVISPVGSQPPEKDKRRHIIKLLVIISVVAAICGVILYCILAKSMGSAENDTTEKVLPQTEKVILPDSIAREKAFVEVIDTVAAGTQLTFLFPENATPELMLGEEALADTTSTLVVQAADIRADNGKIVGAFVLKGDLLSKGEAKAGFCAIVDGKLTIGVADATPMLEQAIANDGYFFRQFPLVVGGQLIENKPKGSSFRKALVEIDDRIGIVLSSDKLTFNQFSQALVDAGVRNAIYLVGSTSSGYYHDSMGRRVKFGKDVPEIKENASFLVWK